MAPVFHELTGRGRTCEIWYTGQHVDELASALDDLGLPAPAEWLVPEAGATNNAKGARLHKRAKGPGRPGGGPAPPPPRPPPPAAPRRAAAQRRAAADRARPRR